MPKHVLVVDDYEEIADTKVWVIQKLTKGEFTAEAVYGGKWCLERLNRTPAVDLILLDMDMPMINGADVIRTLLKMEHPPAKILPMTAWGPDWINHWGLKELSETPAFQHWVGLDTYDKATEVSDMIDAIRRALQR